MKGRDEWERTAVMLKDGDELERTASGFPIVKMLSRACERRGVVACPVDKQLHAPKEFSSTMGDPLDVMSTRPTL